MPLTQDHIEIDRAGDLILQINSESAQHCLKVSSKALCLASPVFRAMLGSPLFLEGRAIQSASTHSPSQLSLHDDDYQSLLIVLNAVHLRTRKIPTSLSVEEFYQLAVVCDKYDLAEIFVPWVTIWVADLRNAPRAQVACPRWLVISWVFRLSKTFEAVTKEMICDASLSVDPITGGDETVQTGIVPSRVFESIRASQQKAASALLSVANKELDRYKSSMETKNSTLCKAMGNFGRTPCSYRYACDNITLGGLIRCLFIAGLWPITLETSSSIQNILTAFKSSKSSTQYLDSVAALYHTNCGPNSRMNSAAQVILAEIKGLQLKDVCPLDADFFTNDN